MVDKIADITQSRLIEMENHANESGVHSAAHVIELVSHVRRLTAERDAAMAGGRLFADKLHTIVMDLPHYGGEDEDA